MLITNLRHPEEVTIPLGWQRNSVPGFSGTRGALLQPLLGSNNPRRDPEKLRREFRYNLFWAATELLRIAHAVYDLMNHNPPFE